MYIVLLNNEILFRTDALDEQYQAISATLETGLNIAGQFVFQIAPNNASYDAILTEEGYIDIYRDATDVPPLWSGRIYSHDEPFDTTLDIVCEGALSILNDSKIMAFSYYGQANMLIEWLLDFHNQSVGDGQKIYVGELDSYFDDTIANFDFTELLSDGDNGYISAKDAFDLMRETYGGYITVLRNHVTGNLLFNWSMSLDSNDNQSIDFGQNLLDIKKSENADDVITAVIPLGKSSNTDSHGVLNKNITLYTRYYDSSVSYAKRLKFYVTEASSDYNTNTSVLNWEFGVAAYSTHSTRWYGQFEAYINDTLVASGNYDSNGTQNLSLSGSLTVEHDAFGKGYCNVWIRYKLKDETSWSQPAGKILLTDLSTANPSNKIELYRYQSWGSDHERDVIVTITETALDVEENYSDLSWRIRVASYERIWDGDSYIWGLSGYTWGTDIELTIDDNVVFDDSAYSASKTYTGSLRVYHNNNAQQDKAVVIHLYTSIAQSPYNNNVYYPESQTKNMILTPLGNAQVADIPVDAHLSIETMVGSYGQKYVEYEPNSTRFGVLPVVKIWDNIEDVIQLYNTAQNWINANSKTETQINISAVDLADAGQNVEHFREGQIIAVTSRPHSIIAQQFAIDKMKIDLFRPEQSKLEINSEV